MKLPTLAQSGALPVADIYRTITSRATLTTSMLTAASRLLNILIFFIPIKILILSHNSNLYIDTETLQNPTILLALSLAIPFLYALYAGLKMVAKKLSTVQLKSLETTYGKNITIRDIEIKTTEAHRRIVNINSELVIIFIAITTTAIYSLYCAAAEIILCATCLAIGYRISLNKQKKDIKERIKDISEHSTTISFILIFISILGALVYTQTDLYLAILALLMARTLFLAIKRAIIETYATKLSLKPVKNKTPTRPPQ